MYILTLFIDVGLRYKNIHINETLNYKILVEFLIQYCRLNKYCIGEILNIIDHYGDSVCTNESK